jgi:hypothetical protein
LKARARGTTIPELLVVMGIMGILLLLAQKVVVFGFEFYRTTDESITLQKEGLLALTWLAQDVALSHHVSIEAVDDPSVNMTVPPYDYPEDAVSIPLPRDIVGKAIVNEEKALTWRSIVGYELDIPNKRLMRYLVDTAFDPQFVTGEPFPDDYISNIEFVTIMPDCAAIKARPDVNTRVAARNVVGFNVDKNVDTMRIELIILLPGRVQAGNSLDNSLTLETTIFPRN